MPYQQATPTIDLTNESDLLAFMLCKIIPMATNYARAYPWFDVDDFLSIAAENMLEALRTQHIQNDRIGYLYRVAQLSMNRTVQRTRSPHDVISPDGWMSGEDYRDGVKHEIADDPQASQPAHSLPGDQRREQLLALLDEIPVKHRMVLQADYQMEDRFGGIWTRQAVQEWFDLDNGQYFQIKSSAIRAIRRKIRRKTKEITTV